MSSGSELIANALFTDLLTGESFDIPTVNVNDAAFTPPSINNNPLYDQIVKLSNSDLTTRTVGGAGTYDAIMESQSNHLKAEYAAGRITGAEYTKAYIALSQNAVSEGVQFLLGKDSAYWSAVNAQMQALIARVQLETAKVQLANAQIETRNQKATFALNKVRLANEDAQYGINKEQIEAVRAQTLDTRSDGVTTVAGSIGKQKALYQQQIDSYKRSSELNAAKMVTDAWAVIYGITEPATSPTVATNDNVTTVVNKILTNNAL